MTRITLKDLLPHVQKVVDQVTLVHGLGYDVPFEEYYDISEILEDDSLQTLNLEEWEITQSGILYVTKWIQ